MKRLIFALFIGIFAGNAFAGPSAWYVTAGTGVAVMQHPNKQ